MPASGQICPDSGNCPGQPAFDAILGVVDEVLSREPSGVERAKRLVLGDYGLSARQALHLAVRECEGVTRILSYSGFDRYPGIERARLAGAPRDTQARTR